MRFVKSLQYDIRNNKQLLILLILPVLWVLIFKYQPMYGLLIAFKDFKAHLGILHSPWVGLKHFKAFINSYMFARVIKNTLIISIQSLICGFPIPILLALALNATKNKPWKKLVQFTIYAPYFISTVVMVSIIIQFLSPSVGAYGHFVKLFNLETKVLMGIPKYFSTIYTVSGIWQYAGYSTIIYLAALAGVDPTLHEVATIDGANRFKRILHVDIPGITPTMVTLLILSVGQLLQIGFEKIFLMQNPLNMISSEIISTYLYRVGLKTGLPKFSYAAAIGFLNSIVNVALLVSVNMASKKVFKTSIW
ncbi:MAG: ABC transporter permease subunit [Spirochaetales bacterium]|nr:ABC transporter permease subunit [Spirochaetales bacterium]